MCGGGGILIRGLRGFKSGGDRPLISMMSKSPPVVLTIAGTDPSGGAGIQARTYHIHCNMCAHCFKADLKTFTSLQCYGASVVTALTAQNTLGVQDVYAPPPDFVQKQVRPPFSPIFISLTFSY